MAWYDRQAFLQGVQVSTASAQPAASAALRGLIWVVQGGAGVADVVQICLKGTADTYSWVTIATAP